jgi:hypothetical protein
MGPLETTVQLRRRRLAVSSAIAHRRRLGVSQHLDCNKMEKKFNSDKR